MSGVFGRSRSAIGVGLIALAAASVASANDIVVGPDGFLFASVRRGIVRIDPGTGAFSVVSSHLVGTGPSIMPLAAGSIAFEASGALVAISDLPGEDDLILRIDPATGNRTQVSGGGQGSGPLLRSPKGLAVAPDGGLIVTDGSVPDQKPARVLRVDAVTGDRTIVSDTSMGSGRRLINPVAVVFGADDNLVVADWKRGSGAFVRAIGFGTDPVQIVLIEPSSGDRSDGPALNHRIPDLVTEASGDLLAAERPLHTFCFHIGPEQAYCTSQMAAVVRIHSDSGEVEVISGSGRCRTLNGTCTGTPRNEVGNGPTLGTLDGVAIEMNGSIVVISGHRVLRVDPVTGDRALLAANVEIPF